MNACDVFFYRYTWCLHGCFDETFHYSHESGSVKGDGAVHYGADFGKNCLLMTEKSLGIQNQSVCRQKELSCCQDSHDWFDCDYHYKHLHQYH